MTLTVQQQQPSDPRKTELPPIVTDKKTGRIYQVGGLLGTGGFAKVFHITEAVSNRVFADKVIDKKVFKEKKNAKEKVEREIMIHRDLRHEHVVTFVTHFEDSQFVHMVLELCPQKTLLHVSNNRKRVTEAEVRYYTRQIVAGVSYLHSRAILHRDLKLGNMFLSANMLVKIGDFGLASTFDDNKNSLCGTPNYIAPEVLGRKGHSPASEVWSLGCMVYALLCGVPPFETSAVDTTYARISAGTFSIPAFLSPASQSFLQAALLPDPQQRATLASLLASELLSGPTPASLPASALSQPPDLSLLHLQPPLRPHHFLSTVLLQFEASLKDLPPVPWRYQSVPHDARTAVPTYVTKWVDYSNKYGFGYTLSNGTVGVQLKNSATVSTDGVTVQYTDQQGKTVTMDMVESGRQQEGDLAAALQLLDFFSGYMASHLAGPLMLACRETETRVQEVPGHLLLPHTRLLHWQRREDHVTMQLSGELVQVNCLSSHRKVVVWQLGEQLLLSQICPGGLETAPLTSPLPPHFREGTAALLDQLRALQANFPSE